MGNKTTRIQLVGIIILSIGSFFINQVNAQIDSSSMKHTKGNQLDFWDILNNVLYKHPPVREDTSAIKTGKLRTSILTGLEYSQITGLDAAISSTVAFYTSNATDANLSYIKASIHYTQKKQIKLPIHGNFWTKGNKYNILTEGHYYKFPQTTYGLGGYTTIADADSIDFSYINLYQTILKKLAPNFFLGFGYNFDYHWNIKEVNSRPSIKTGFDQYGFTTKSIASGVTLNLLYDARRNPMHPKPSYYLNIVLRNNFTFLGSDNNWQSLLIDARRYLHFPNHSSNTLAFWTYDWFATSGKPPYLSLVNTASDNYMNMGRGYIQGRFRGQDLLYLESEYRFGITNNGLFGGVIFANTQSYSEPLSHHFEKMLPGCGIGVRFKLNKFSKTNADIDYGFGANGSHGLFFNIGEMF